MKFSPQLKYSYRMPTQIYYKRGFINQLPKIIKKQDIQNVLIISGTHVRRFEIYKNFLREIKKTIKTFEYKTIIRKSDFNTINKLIVYCRKNKIGAIIAIGGGTILDTGKCAAVLATHEKTAQQYVRDITQKLKHRGLFFIAVPTTAGTGSEVTPWATIWGEDKKKYSLASKEYMFPDIAIVDPSLTDTLPPAVTAESGIDALTQAIECYWSINNNLTSDKFALKAIKAIIDNLEFAVNKPTQKVRDKMAWGALLGGLGFSNTQTTICHSVSYPMTAHWGVAHGQAVSITLPIFLAYIFPALSIKRQKKLLGAIGADSSDKAVIKIIKLMKVVGLKTRLSELGIDLIDIDSIVREGYHPDRAKNSPKVPSTEELKRMLYSIY